MQVGGVLLAYQTIQAVDVIPGIHDHSPVQGHRHLRTGPRQCLHFATGINSISQHLINWQLMDNLDASPPKSVQEIAKERVYAKKAGCRSLKLKRNLDHCVQLSHAVPGQMKILRLAWQHSIAAMISFTTIDPLDLKI